MAWQPMFLAESACLSSRLALQSSGGSRQERVLQLVQPDLLCKGGRQRRQRSSGVSLLTGVRQASDLPGSHMQPCVPVRPARVEAPTLVPRVHVLTSCC